MAVVAQGVFPGSSGFQTAEIFPAAGGVSPASPTLENMQKCFAKQDTLQENLTVSDLKMDLFSPGCYPLSIPLYVVMDKHMKKPPGGTCSDPLFPAVQATKWWKWMLLAKNIEAPMRASNIVHLKDYAQARLPFPGFARTFLVALGALVRFRLFVRFSIYGNGSEFPVSRFLCFILLLSDDNDGDDENSAAARDDDDEGAAAANDDVVATENTI